MRFRVDQLPHGGSRVRLGDDEREVPELRAVRFEHEARSTPRLDVELNAVDGCDIELDGEVHVHFVVFEGFEMRRDDLGEGRARWHAVRSGVER